MFHRFDSFIGAWFPWITGMNHAKMGGNKHIGSTCPLQLGGFPQTFSLFFLNLFKLQTFGFRLWDVRGAVLSLGRLQKSWDHYTRIPIAYNACAFHSLFCRTKNHRFAVRDNFSPHIESFMKELAHIIRHGQELQKMNFHCSMWFLKLFI